MTIHLRILIGFTIIALLFVVYRFYPMVESQFNKPMAVMSHMEIDNYRFDYNNHKNNIKDLKYELKYEHDWDVKVRLANALTNAVAECNDLVNVFNRKKPNNVEKLQLCED